MDNAMKQKHNQRTKMRQQYDPDTIQNNTCLKRELVCGRSFASIERKKKKLKCRWPIEFDESSII